MTDYKPLVTKVTQNTVFSPDGSTQAVFLVQFTVGPHGPFTVQVPQADFTQQGIQAKLEQFAQTVNSLPQSVS